MESLKSLSLFVLSCLLTLLLFEGALRLVEHFSNGESLDQQLKRSAEATPLAEQGNTSLGGLIIQSKWPDVVYEMKPFLNTRFQGKALTTNEFGMREGEVSKIKTPGTFRIAGIGDSVIFGWGVEQNETYLKLLEEKLTQTAGRKIETLNFGVPGYNTAMEVSLFERRGIEFSPDLVLMHFVSNDFDVPAFMLEKQDPLDLSKSFLLDFIYSRLNSKQKPALKSVQRVDRNKSMSHVRNAYRPMTGARGTYRALKKLRGMTIDRGIPVHILYGKVTKEQFRVLKKARDSLGFTLIPIGEFVPEALKKRGIPNTPVVRKKLLTVAPKDRHPSALAHEIIADGLVEKLGSSILARP